LIFEEHQQKYFKQIRESSNISSHDLSLSFNPDINEDIFWKELTKEQAGKSGLNVIKTFDSRFVIKQITQLEKHLLITMSKGYMEYLCANERSLLSKIYGLFTIKIKNASGDHKHSKYHFIVM
jgi:hypothetical protein